MVDMVRKLQVKSNLEKVIENGANVIADASLDKLWKVFPLRLRSDISKKIDTYLDDRIGISKTAWILEAIQEKLRKEQNENLP